MDGIEKDLLESGYAPEKVEKYMAFYRSVKPGMEIADFCAGVNGEYLEARVGEALADIVGCVQPMLGEGVKIGNMVVASHTVQYDYDTTAIGEPKGFVMIGSEGVVQLPTSAKHNAVLEKYAEKIYNGVHTGVIATGDRFVADPAFCLQLKAEFGAISCEMETGAVAQVCAVNKTPFCGLRAISDNANDEGSVDFETFAKSSAEKCIELLKDAVGELNEVQ